MQAINCPCHGISQSTYVCQHIAEGLLRHQRVGFFWTTDDPGNPFPDAWCRACQARVRQTNGEWEGEAAEHLRPKVMCCHCYGIAKTFHMGGNPWS